MAKKVTKKSKRKIIILGLTSIGIIGYFCFTLIGYIVNYNNLKKEQQRLNVELANLKQEKEDIKSEIVKLNDPDYLARYAKEKFLYSSDGEYVIKLTEEKNNSNEITTANNKNYVLVVLAILVLTLIVYKNRNVIKKKIIKKEVVKKNIVSI